MKSRKCLVIHKQKFMTLNIIADSSIQPEHLKFMKDKIMKISLISKNKVLIDEYVSSYFELTKKSIRNTLSLAKIVYEVKDKYEYSQIDEEDFKYFCKQIQVNDESSQFRKYLCIAKSADKIEEHLDKFPTAMSVVYKIISLPPDDFDELIQTNLLSPDLTMSKINVLFPSTKQLKSNSQQHVTVDDNNLRIDITLDNKNKSLSKEMKDTISFKIFNCLESVQDNFYHFDNVSVYVNNEYKHSRKYANKNVL